MVNPIRAERLKSEVERILSKELSIKDVQAILNMHCNVLDDDSTMLIQLQDRKTRGLVP